MLKYAVLEVCFGFAWRRRQGSVTPCAFLRTVTATALLIVGVFSLSLSFAHGNPCQKDSFFSLDFPCVEMFIGRSRGLIFFWEERVALVLTTSSTVCFINLNRYSIVPNFHPLYFLAPKHGVTFLDIQIFLLGLFID